MSGLILDDTKIWSSKNGLNYSRVFFFERKYFDESYIDGGHDWIYHNWKLSILYAGIYIAAIFSGQAYMKTREKFDFRRGLIAWNLVLSGFSALGAIRLWPEFIYTIRTFGVEHSVCNQDYAHGVSGCWTWMFILSKLPELVDTLFIVVRKQKLIFLHWYHHATVLIYCWYSTHDFSATGRWFVLMNYTIHAIMYGYYAFRALRFTIPKWIMITITTGQISQMVVGIYVNLVAYYRKNRGEECHVTYDNIKWSFIMYFTYFLLFVYFFYTAYLTKSKKGSIRGTSAATEYQNSVGKKIQ